MDTVNVIIQNLFDDDYQRLVGEFIEQGITKYKFHEAITDRKTVVESINASFKKLVQDAKDRNLPYTILGEQDMTFPCKGAWEYFIKNKPDFFDVYIGGSYLYDMNNHYEAPLVKVNSWVGNHLIIVAQRFYDAFLSVPHDQHIDTAQQGLGQFYVCYPYAALQRPGFSANNKAQVNYNAKLKPEEIYNGT